MTRLPARDPVNDHPQIPKHSALVTIYYQPVQVNSIPSMDRQLLANNIGTANTTVDFGQSIARRRKEIVPTFIYIFVDEAGTMGIELSYDRG
jgi:hypothetical protein